MPSPETQRVIDESIEVLVQNTDTKKPEEFRANLRALVANDRQHIHTSLVAAVEGKKRPTVCHTLHCLKGKAENHDMCVMNVPAVDLAYNQALEDTLTIINSIFKE